MTAVIAIVGQTNVGKSTLFNRLTKSREALVIDQANVTRDRRYGMVHYLSRHFLIIDTGGLLEKKQDDSTIAKLIQKQSLQSIEEADTLLWVLDGRNGIGAIDEQLAHTLRKFGKPVHVLLNKLEGINTDTIIPEFYRLGFDSVHSISAKRGNGIQRALNQIVPSLPKGERQVGKQRDAITLCLLGKPNAGKSTLTNQIVGEERMLVFEQAITTRDSIHIPFERSGRSYVIIDTAGIRKSTVRDHLEKLSVIQTFRSVEQADIILCVVDAYQGITEQDRALLGVAKESGKGTLILLNKQDKLDAEGRKRLRDQVDEQCHFIDYAHIHHISALHGQGIDKVFNTITKIRHAHARKFSAHDLTTMLYQCTTDHPPPMIRGRRIKLRYAHLGNDAPLKIIIHGNQTRSVPAAYKRYLARAFRKKMRLVSTPVLIEFKRSNNPYKDKKA